MLKRKGQNQADSKQSSPTAADNAPSSNTEPTQLTLEQALALADSIEKQMKELLANIAELQGKNTQLKALNEGIKKAHIQQNNQITRLESIAKNQQSHQASLVKLIDQLKQDVARLTEENIGLKSKAEEQQSHQADLLVEIVQLRQEVARLAEQNETLAEKNETLADDKKRLESQLKTSERNKGSYKGCNQQLREKLKELQKELKELRKKHEHLEESKQHNRDREESLIRQKAEVGLENKQLKMTIETLRAKNSELEQEKADRISQLSRTIDELKTTLESLTGKFKQKESEYLETILALQKNLTDLAKENLNLRQCVEGVIEAQSTTLRPGGLTSSGLSMFPAAPTARPNVPPPGFSPHSLSQQTSPTPPSK